VEDGIRDKFRAASCHLPARTEKKHKKLLKKMQILGKIHSE
jgi:hypothetical protein